MWYTIIIKQQQQQLTIYQMNGLRESSVDLNPPPSPNLPRNNFPAKRDIHKQFRFYGLFFYFL